jgi:hypothetical protein
MPRRVTRIKATLHRRVDPLLSWPDHRQARRALSTLPDGGYRASVEVPYYAQFASPDRVYDYIHHGYDGVRDPNWHVFGADDPAEYAFWAPRVCALACLKMAIEAYYPDVQPSLWDLVQQGLVLDGYRVQDGNGRWIDEGWYYAAQVRLAARYGLRVEGRAYASPLSVCRAIRDGGLVAATVTPDIGERRPHRQRYGGHLVLVYGFDWQAGRPSQFHLHNPSGRFAELQDHAVISAVRFRAAFAYRFMVLHPAL